MCASCGCGKDTDHGDPDNIVAAALTAAAKAQNISVAKVAQNIADYVKAKMSEPWPEISVKLFRRPILASERKAYVLHMGGNTGALTDWYNDGADGQIDWGSPGDFDQCVSVASKYLASPEGFCNLRHNDAVGGPPGSEGK